MNALAVAIVIVVMGAATSAGGQTPTGAIVGVVDDPSGQPVQRAVVTITNRDTGQSRKSVTAPTGTYAAAVLAPGVYRISVVAAGFKRLEREVAVEAGTTTT